VKPKDVIGTREPRQRVLRDNELRSIWAATGALSYPFGPFIRLLLITGQRRAEISDMRWDEIDWDKALWTIPAGRMKGAAAHEVPLSTLAVELLKSLPRWKGPHVFTTTDGARPISAFSSAKQRMDRALGDEFVEWRFHDLRRTMRTHLSALPVPDRVAELCIVHTKPGLHKVYDQHGYRDEKRRALGLWAERLSGIVGEADGGEKVVSIRNRVALPA
jgi:integrase